MADSPSWMKQFDSNQRDRSQSQSGSASHWDAARSSYQPLKWQPEYNLGASPSNAPSGPETYGQNSRSPASSSIARPSLFPRMTSGSSLDTIPEDNFLDRGTDFRFVGGVRNPAFEMDNMNVNPRHYDRRSSDSVLIDKGYQGHFKQRNEQRENPDVNGCRNTSGDFRTGRRKSAHGGGIPAETRHDTRSEVSAGCRSVQSNRSSTSTYSDSMASEDTKLTSLSTRSERRLSEVKVKAGHDRRASVTSTSTRRSWEAPRSVTGTNTGKSESTTLTNTTAIQIPIEFIETPTTRIKKLFGPIIMCTLVMTLAASLGAAIYFATVLKEAQEQTIGLLKAQLEMATSGVNVQTLSLHQKQSLTQDYCKQMDLFYSESMLFHNAYKKCEVNSLTNGRITFTLYFDENGEETTTDNIVSVLMSHAKAERQVQVNQLKVDIDSLKVTLLKADGKRAQENVPKEEESIVDVTKLPISRTPPISKKSDTPSPAHWPRPTTAPTTPKRGVTWETTITRGAVTTPDPIPNPCEGRSGDYFPHHRECNLYIQCHHGDSITFACPSDTVFDIDKKVCVQRTDDVVCPHKTPGKGYDRSNYDPWDPCSSGDGLQYYQYPDECNLFFQCQYNKSVVRLCPQDTVFDRDRQICVPPAPDVKCYVITTTVPVPAATEEHPTGSTTTLAPIVYPTRPRYDNHPCQQATSRGIYPHPNDCNKYILCEHGNERTKACASGLYFDPIVSACVRPINDLICPDIRPCAGLDAGLFPHPRICRKFIMCNLGKEILQTCMDGDVWDPRANSCMSKTDSSECPESNT